MQQRQSPPSRLKKLKKSPGSRDVVSERTGSYLNLMGLNCLFELFYLKYFYNNKRHTVFRFPGFAKFFNFFKNGLHDIVGTGR